AGAPSSGAPDRHPSSRPWPGSPSAWPHGPCARIESPGCPPARPPIGSSSPQVSPPDLGSTLGGPRRIPHGAFVRPRSDPLAPPGRTLVCATLVPVVRGPFRRILPFHFVLAGLEIFGSRAGCLGPVDQSRFFRLHRLLALVERRHPFLRDGIALRQFLLASFDRSESLLERPFGAE